MYGLHSSEGVQRRQTWVNKNEGVSEEISQCWLTENTRGVAKANEWHVNENNLKESDTLWPSTCGYINGLRYNLVHDAFGFSFS